MKKIFICLATVLLWGGCTKDLVPVDYSEINPSIFPQSEADVQAMVNACYYPLRGSWWDGINSTSERGIMFCLDATTEILSGKFDIQQYGHLLNFHPTDDLAVFFYDWYYNKISRMTLTIDLINESKVSDEIKKKAIAQVRCARGLLAYDLYDMYGPLVIAPLEVLKNPMEEKPLARLSNDEMVKFIEDDLIAAANDLPDPGATEYGRFSKGLAKMINIRLMLHEKKWDKVKALCDDIIQMNYYKLETDYVGMWGLNGARNSKEVIWAIPCDYDGTSENQWQLMVLPSNYPPLGGWATVQSTWYFYDSFESADIRKTMLIAEYTGTDGILYNRANPGTNIDLGPIPLKINPDALRTTSLSTVDIIQYRYADVLLSKAEAIANMGAPDAEAMELVNVIRRRAGLQDKDLSDYSSLDAFNDMILTERSHEYWCENGQYRADLIRHGKFVSRCIELTQSPYANDSKIVFPFSLSKISEGKGLFIQNPGYN
ncbi:MAG TPA: RagB/SusD family nutrient uptake outer membrane protein [Bacteroidales bacterium]